MFLLINCKEDSARDNATVVSPKEFRTNIYSAAADDAAKPVQYVGTSENDLKGAITAAASNVTTKGNKISVDVGDLTQNQAKYYMLIVWFEGQDEDCQDAFAGNEMPNIDFTIAATK